MRTFDIKPVSQSLAETLRHKIDGKTKPIGSLGRLEDIALRIGLIQQTTSPSLNRPHLLVYAGDHGIVAEGVSAYPQDVTWQMVKNFLQGGAAASVLCKQHGIKLLTIDAGVNYDFDRAPGLIINKTGRSTSNFLYGPAITPDQVDHAFSSSAAIVKDVFSSGCNVIGFGEMGIGNTSSAAAMMSIVCGLSVDLCVGRGTGLSDDGLNRKTAVLRQSLMRNTSRDVRDVLSEYGGFEIAQMTGGILQAAELGMVILIDGFISSVSCLLASTLCPHMLEYCIFCHQSAERAHTLLLDYLNATPILNLEMRLGEGSGIAVALPIVQSALTFLNQMASFESAGVSGKEG